MTLEEENLVVDSWLRLTPFPGEVTGSERKA